MKRKIIYRPTFRCQQCSRIRIRDGLIAWFFQPPMPTTGRGDSAGALYFVCRPCRQGRTR